MKWKGVLFLRFLLALVDESSKIRELADFLFGNILKGYFPRSMLNHRKSQLLCWDCL